MTENSVEVAIIGGGIAGLTTAIALNRAGVDAQVFEQAPAYGEIGGHLTIDDPAIAVLARWGLDQKFHDISCQLEGMQVKKLDTGEEVVSMPFPDLGSLGVNDDGRMGTRVVHSFLRADFLGMLLAEIPEGKVHVGHRLTALQNADDGGNSNPVATFENGTEVSATVILAADGVRSLARKMFDDVPAVAAGHTVLRTMCSADILPDDLPTNRMLFWDGWAFGDKAAGVGVHALTVPVRGEKFISVDLQFQGGDQLEDCNPSDLPVDRVMGRYPDTLDPIISKMIEARVEPLAAYPLFDRPVANKWVDGRIALMGDAAHSMRPNLGQGGCQSIHDAGAIADAFAEHGVTHEALKVYEAVRKPYTQSIVEAAKNIQVDPKAWKDKGKPA
ncbi:MAG: NAD(P)/FAD-dependent oxidoreductase [Parasphingorhabdus sp.]|uniref:FAD-dependent oxidoreductase n=1 Tax=Parasphingorhabdus sp. TaxID=2709688 RepID=UPI003267A632